VPLQPALSPELARLAGTVLAHEWQYARTTLTLAEAGERVFARLRAQAGRWLGTEGFRALLARSLETARTEHPFLAGINAGRGPAEACLPGLAEALRDQDPEAIRRGLASLFTGFLGLLATFIGEELVQRQLDRAWPGTRVDGTADDPGRNIP
jgi:hypothetical protein